MTDRSYLPYQSARDFQDRGMAKWAGFFLSEHSSALQHKKIDRSRLRQLTLRDKWQLLSQAYSQQLPLHILYLDQDQLQDIQGLVAQLDAVRAIIRQQSRYTSLAIHDILTIEAKGDTDALSQSAL